MHVTKPKYESTKISVGWCTPNVVPTLPYKYDIDAMEQLHVIKD